MIHRRKGRKLKRTASHRKAMLSNLSASLIKSKKVNTTLAKAKELRIYIEPIINKSKKAYLSKDDSSYNVHLRREVNRFLNDRVAVKELFDEIGPKVSERNGGYTRVLKMGRRIGDGAELALIELVDYNMEQAKKTETPAEDSETQKKPKSKKTKKETKTEDTAKKTTSKGRKKKQAAA